MESELLGTRITMEWGERKTMTGTFFTDAQLEQRDRKSREEGFEAGFKARSCECGCYVKGEFGDKFALDGYFADYEKSRGK